MTCWPRATWNAWRAVETQGIQKLNDYDVGGLQGPVNYTPGDNRLSKSLRIFQVKGGNHHPDHRLD